VGVKKIVLAIVAKGKVIVATN